MTDVNKIIGDDNKDDKLDKTKDVISEVAKLTEGKYKSTEDLVKAYKDVEKKLGEMSDEVGKSREFATMIQPILDEIRADQEIFDKLDKKLRDKNDPKAKDKKTDKKGDGKEANTEVREKMSDIIVAQFEEKYNFSELSKEDQKKLRNDIGNEILELTGTKLADIDLRRQASILEKAYKLVNSDSKQNTSNETDDDNKNDGAISRLKSQQGKPVTTLTSEEATVATRLGLTREQYLAGKRK